MSFNIGATSNVETVVVPAHKTKKTELNIRKISNNIAAGYNFALSGGQSNGKTTSMLSFGFLNSIFYDAWKDKYPALAKALKRGVIPEVSRIFVIESENQIDKQLNRGFEAVLYKDIKDIVDIVDVDVVVRRDKINDEDMSVYTDPESIRKIEEAHDKYVLFSQTAKECGPETVIGVDSASRFDDLLNAKSNIILGKRTAREVSDKVKEAISQSSWEWRNSWWNEVFINIRGAKGFTVSTFMLDEIPIQYQKPGGPKVRIKWPPRAEYNYDQIYELYKTDKRNLKARISEFGTSRYVFRGDKCPKNDWDLDVKYTFFPVLEGMIQAMGEW